MFYHASSVPEIKQLEPKISNHNIPLIYFSSKRENVLVYLSNAVEKYCKETGYKHNGKWHKWGSYGFTKDGILRLEEYYPNATEDTYKGVSAYIYSVDSIQDIKTLKDIPFAYTTDREVPINSCEYVPDAYEAIMEAVAEGKIILEKYEDMSEQKHEWIKKTIKKEYTDGQATYEYRHFIKGKFPFVETV